jgi:uncharacterized membrane protein YphA (DoxX/SURF4 family)
MFKSIDRDSLGAFVLRLALGIVFLVHGLEKVIADGNSYGWTWATNQWNAAGRPPERVVNALAGDVEGVPPEYVVKAKNHIEKVYNLAGGDRPENLKDLEAVQMFVAWGEILCSIALILGAFTQPAALLMILVQIGAIVTVTGLRGFSPPSGRIGYEYNLVLIAMCLALLIEGGGMLSIDAWRGGKKKPKTAVAEPVAV